MEPCGTPYFKEAFSESTPLVCTNKIEIYIVINRI